MRVGSTGPVTYLTGQTQKVTGQTYLDIYVPWSVGWSLVPRTFPKMSCSLAFLPAVCSIIVGCASEKMRKRPQPTHGQLATPVTLDHGCTGSTGRAIRRAS